MASMHRSLALLCLLALGLVFAYYRRTALYRHYSSPSLVASPSLSLSPSLPLSLSPLSLFPSLSLHFLKFPHPPAFSL
jgi:hypothetical protein